MKSICPSIWSTYLLTCHHLNVPFVIQPNSTLNALLEIQASASLQANEKPGLHYLTIGNGGHRAVTGADGFPLTDSIDHQADHAALYNHIPFVIRDLDDDLAPEQRANYALRKQIVVDGLNKIAYYAKRINLNNIEVKIKKTVVEDGVATSTDYVTSSANLHPIPPVLPPVGAISTSGEYLSTSAILSIPFTEVDVAELLNVARTLYNDERYAVISEFGFCTGVDRIVQISTPLGQANFSEVIACQIATFVSAHYEMLFNTKGFDFSIETGAVEPLLGSEQISTATLLG